MSQDKKIHIQRKLDKLDSLYEHPNKKRKTNGEQPKNQTLQILGPRKRKKKSFGNKTLSECSIDQILEALYLSIKTNGEPNTRQASQHIFGGEGDTNARKLEACSFNRLFRNMSFKDGATPFQYIRELCKIYPSIQNKVQSNSLLTNPVGRGQQKKSVELIQAIQTLGKDHGLIIQIKSIKTQHKVNKKRSKELISEPKKLEEKLPLSKKKNNNPIKKEKEHNPLSTEELTRSCNPPIVDTTNFEQFNPTWVTLNPSQTYINYHNCNFYFPPYTPSQYQNQGIYGINPILISNNLVNTTEINTTPPPTNYGLSQNPYGYFNDSNRNDEVQQFSNQTIVSPPDNQNNTHHFQETHVSITSNNHQTSDNSFSFFNLNDDLNSLENNYLDENLDFYDILDF